MIKPFTQAAQTMQQSETQISINALPPSPHPVELPHLKEDERIGFHSSGDSEKQFQGPGRMG